VYVNQSNFLSANYLNLMSCGFRKF